MRQKEIEKSLYQIVDQRASVRMGWTGIQFRFNKKLGVTFQNTLSQFLPKMNQRCHWVLYNASISRKSASDYCQYFYGLPKLPRCETHLFMGISLFRNLEACDLNSWAVK